MKLSVGDPTSSIGQLVAVRLDMGKGLTRVRRSNFKGLGPWNVQESIQKLKIHSISHFLWYMYVRVPRLDTQIDRSSCSRQNGQLIALGGHSYAIYTNVAMHNLPGSCIHNVAGYSGYWPL